MILSDLSIKRPIFSISINIIIILVGILSLLNLSLQQYPQVDEPVLTVETQYYGASPALVESKVTNILENILSGINGLDYIESTSQTGSSNITLNFKAGKSITEASSEVRERISQVRSDLPTECKDPTIKKSETNQREFLYLVLTSKTYSDLELYDYADRNLKDRIEAIQGVASATVYGNPYTMQIELNRDKLQSFNLSVTDILDNLKSSSQELPAGRIIKGNRYINIVTATGLNTPKDMGKLVIKANQGRVVHLSDIAQITLGRDSYNIWEPRFKGVPAVFLAVSKTSNSNILDIVKQIKNIIPQVHETLPEGMHLNIGFDFSIFIQAALSAVEHTIFEAIFLVIAIIFVFLRSIRATLIPLLTIPISLMGSFAFLYAFGCSINTITLLAMVLAIGLVVDDAIVVLENIHRHIEEGLSPIEAAFKGSQEISFAIIAMTITLSSVFAPIAFIQGLTGQLFSEFAIALAGSVLISGVVALTLSPMMCSRLLKPHQKQSKAYWVQQGDKFFERLDQYYENGLKFVLNSPKLVASALLSTFIIIYISFSLLPQELGPQEDQGVILSFTQGTDSSTLEPLLAYTDIVEDYFKKTPEIEGFWSVTNSGAGAFVGASLKPWSQRKRYQGAIISDLRKKFMSIPGARSYIFPMKTLLTEGQGGLQIVVKTSGSYEELEEIMDNLVATLKKIPEFESVSHSLQLNTPQIKIDIDRNKAALMDVSIADIGSTLQTMMGGNQASTFEMDGRSYDIIVRTPTAHQQNFDDIGNLFVKSNAEDGQKTLIPITQFITLKEIAIPNEIKHFNKMRKATLSIDLSPGYDLNKSVSLIKTTASHIFNSKMQIEYAGNLRKFFASSNEMYLLFIAALMFTYLILAIQFESFLDPLLILITVPLSLSGALAALYLSGSSLNIYSQIGLITLVGLITKHGILIIEFANQEISTGKKLNEAIVSASLLRLRPILMTTGAMILGALPLAFSSGAGAESRQQIGWVLVGGLLLGTTLTLFILPFIYKFIKENKWPNQLSSLLKKSN